MLKDKDTDVRTAQERLDEVVGFFADNKDDLTGALEELGKALGQVKTFIEDHRGELRKNVDRLVPITRTLVRQRASLAEALDVAPLAAGNVVNAYNPDTPAPSTAARTSTRSAWEDPCCRCPSPAPPPRAATGPRARGRGEMKRGTRTGGRAASALGRGAFTTGRVAGLTVGGLIALGLGFTLAVGGVAALPRGFGGVEDLPLPGGADLGDRPYTVTAELGDVLSLVPHSAVRVNDVAVGRVTAIELGDDWTARVTMEINGAVTLPADATARLEQSSLLGEKYVQLVAPAGRARAAGCPTAASSRCPAPVAPPRSRRCSARCPCCSTAAASTS